MNITSEGVSHLIPGLKTLKSLDLSYGNPLISIPTLSALTLLQCLDLSGNTMVTNKTLQSLPPSLRVLDVASCSAISDSAFDSLTLPHLISLNVSFCFLITDRAIETFATRFPFLQSLNLSCCTQITDNGLTHLPSQLVCLNLEGCMVSDLGMQAVGALSKLEYLNLNLCEVTDIEIHRLQQLHLTSLEQTTVPTKSMPIKPPSYFLFELTKGFKLGTTEAEEMRRAKDRKLWQEEQDRKSLTTTNKQPTSESMRLEMMEVEMLMYKAKQEQMTLEWEREREERRLQELEWEREREERRRREEEWEREREERRRREEEWEREREARRQRELERELEWEREKKEMQREKEERGTSSSSSLMEEHSVTLEVVNKGRGGFPSASQLEVELAKRFEMPKENFAVLFKTDESSGYIWYVVTCFSRGAKEKLMSYKMFKLCGCVLKSRTDE